MFCFIALLLLVAGPSFAFDKALPGYQYQFPRDHFQHTAFQTEWWYYTGNLKTAEGRQFGFELTFFRLGVDRQAATRSAWEIGDLYLAHLALSDISGGKFHKDERLNRRGPGLAGADVSEARIWNGNWQVTWLAPEEPLGSQRLQAVSQDFSLDFLLEPAKPPVIHGRNGISRKAEGEGKASHYISFTRLNVSGAIELSGERHSVRGLAWMDHEFSTDSMGPGQVGWDWLSIQLDNNSELMLYRMRREDGSADSHSSGTYVGPDGKALHLEWSEIVMEPGDNVWRSPETGGVYPVEWKVAVPRLALELTCRALLPAQEVVSGRQLGPNYWEGATSFEGRMKDESVTGVGYLEMTGYDKPIRLQRAQDNSAADR